MYAEAEPLLKRALEVNEKIFGERHPNTIMVMTNYAFVLEKLGKKEEAKAMTDRAAKLKP